MNVKRVVAWLLNDIRATCVLVRPTSSSFTMLRTKVFIFAKSLDFILPDSSIMNAKSILCLPQVPETDN